jgi:hypothetical protein
MDPWLLRFALLMLRNTAADTKETDFNGSARFGQNAKEQIRGSGLLRVQAVEHLPEFVGCGAVDDPAAAYI